MMRRGSFLGSLFGRTDRPRHRAARAGWAGRPGRGPLWLQQLEPRLALAADDLTWLGPIGVGGVSTDSGGPNRTVTLESKVYFPSNDGTAGAELWRSDGTAAGTFLVKDISPGAADSSPAYLTIVGSQLFFAARHAPTDTIGIWRSDGTSANTTIVKSFPAKSYGPIRDLTAVNSKLFFTIEDGNGFIQLWVTNGTPAGTTLVKTFVPQSNEAGGSGLEPLTAVGSMLFFAAYDGATGRELWASDGNPGGTAPVKDIRPGVDGSNPQKLTAVGPLLYFTANDGTGGRELWTSDGKAAGTTQVKDIFPGLIGSEPADLVPVGNSVFFSADDGAVGRELWTSNGTATGTMLVKDINPLASSLQIGWESSLFVVGTTVYFSADDGSTGRELWSSNGTPQGTTRVQDIAPGKAGSNPAFLAAVGSTLYFEAFDGATGFELWKKESNAAAAVRVKDIRPGGQGSGPSFMGIAGQTLLFSADDGFRGRELWRTDGNAAGTFLVKDINPGLVFTDPQIVATIGSDVFVAAKQPDSKRAVWKTGAGQKNLFTVPTGAVSLPPGPLLPQQVTVAGATLLVAASDPQRGVELASMVDDNQSPQKFLTIVKDIAPGPAGSNPTWLTPLDTKIVFAANDGSTGAELWASDGSEAGTVRLKDIRSGAAGSFPAFLTRVGPLVYFQADDGVTGAELWRTDGTPQGTFRVKDIVPGSGTSACAQFTVVGNTLFFTANDGISGNELWTSNGTPQGTVRVRDIRPGPAGSGCSSLTAVGSKLYFVADDGVSGAELWTSDGSEIGTVRVKDIRPGPQGSAPMTLTAVGMALYFSADDGTKGREPWRSTGSAPGTVLIKDVFPGPTGSAPESFKPIGSTVVFTANDGVAGREIWQTDGSSGGTRLSRDIGPGGFGSVPASLEAVGSSLYFTAYTNPFASAPSFWRLEVSPLSPALTFAPGVGGLVSLPAATQATGIVTVAGTAGNQMAVSFVGTTNGQPDAKKIVTKYLTAIFSGVPLPVTLTPADLVTIGDGPVSVVATQMDKVTGRQSDPAALSFTLDTVPPAAPVLAMGPGLDFTVPKAKATQAAGIVTMQGQPGLTTTVLFYGTSNGQIDQKKLVIKYVTGKGAFGPTPVTLTAADLKAIGTGAILSVGVQYDAAGNPSQPYQMWLTIV